MTDQTYELTTDQAEREASGAHACGRFLEEFEVGAASTPAPIMSLRGSASCSGCP